jgi:hypothetical protein
MYSGAILSFVWDNVLVENGLAPEGRPVCFQAALWETFLQAVQYGDRPQREEKCDGVVIYIGRQTNIVGIREGCGPDGSSHKPVRSVNKPGGQRAVSHVSDIGRT